MRFTNSIIRYSRTKILPWVYDHIGHLLVQNVSRTMQSDGLGKRIFLYCRILRYCVEQHLLRDCLGTWSM